MNHSLTSTAHDSMIFHKEEINRMSRIVCAKILQIFFPSAKCLIGQGQLNKLMEHLTWIDEKKIIKSEIKKAWNFIDMNEKKGKLFNTLVDIQYWYLYSV